MPAFLIEDVWICEHLRLEDRVQIYFHQVEVVLLDAARYRIKSLVREGHRVEEGVHRSLQKLDERLLYRIFFGSAKDGVLEYVEHAGAVLGQGPEADREELVLVAVVRPHKLGARHVVDHLDKSAADLSDLAYVGHGKPVDLIIYLHFMSLSVFGSDHTII